jgi:glucosamine--fructose-6-phosphate aminotransferase (isomerizing)
VIASDDATGPAVVEAVRRANDAGAPVIASGPAAARVGDVAFTLETPAAPDPLLTPLLSVLPGQLFARALALAKGIDPETPRHLRKITSAV